MVPDDPQKELVVRRPELPIVSVTRGPRHAPVQQSLRPVQRLGGGAGSNNFVPALGGDGTKIAPTGDIFGQPPGGMSSVRGKLADHVRDHVVLSPEGSVLVTSTGAESSYPHPSQSLNNSSMASASSNRASSLNGAFGLSKSSVENFLKHPQAILVRRLISRVMSASSVMRPPRYTNWWT